MRDRRKSGRRLIMLVGIVIVAMSLSSCAALKKKAAAKPAPKPVPAATAIPASNSGAETQVLNASNRLRAQNHRAPLRVHSALTNKARYWSRWMAAGNCGRANGVAKICHSTLAGGIRVAWTMLAENVGMASPKNNVLGVIQGLEASPGHRANILNTSVDWVGVGVAYDGNAVYITQEFMAT
jgi:uncharacterized protein YkwD